MDPVDEITRTLDPGLSWNELRARFQWPRPSRLNIADAAVGRHARAEPGRLALRHLRADDRREDWTYGELDRAARRLANALAAHGVERGDRVGVRLAQSPQTLIAHLAAWRLGAISTPLSSLFGAEALTVRLRDAAAKALICDAAGLATLDRSALPALRLVVSTGGPGDGAVGWEALLEAASETQRAVDTDPEEPAFIAYTSGTTGAPKGALHAHRCLLGHLPGARLAHDFLPGRGDVMWTPADWAWMGGLLNVALPALCWRVPLISHRMEKFDPERAWALIREEGVSACFAPPTALRLMRQVPPGGAALRSLASGGEALGAGMLAWGREALGLEIAEFYGQTECNKVLTNCPRMFEPAPGSTGRAIPGHDVSVLDADGRPAPPGETGEIAVRRGSAAMFLGYWGRPDQTAEKFMGEWMRSGDEARMDEQGRFFFSGRTDDVITSAGYRIGPSEIEDCLARHPAIALAAAVGLPDPIRTEIVCAVVTLAPGASADGLEAALAAHVRERLGGHAAPRRVVVVEAMPITTTGKIMRRELRTRLSD